MHGALYNLINNIIKESQMSAELKLINNSYSNKIHFKHRTKQQGK